MAIDQSDGWIQVAESRWLPKTVLVGIDTTNPCVFQNFCDALKTGKIATIDFSSCGLGSPAMEILSDWVRDGATVADLNISEAIIGDAGATLAEAISSSTTLNFITIGKGLRLPLKDNYDLDVFDASQKGIESGGVAVIAWWLTTPAAAVVSSMNVSGQRSFATIAAWCAHTNATCMSIAVYS